MSKEELIEKLKKLQDCGDPEIAHSEADELILAYLNDTEITEEFKKITKWYA